MKLINSDCIEAMRQMEDASVDSIVTDPPYELGFMGKKWDSTGIAFNVEVWQECLRVLKPGGHLLAFSGSRTYHRMAVAIEDAGFEIRDQIMWIYGSGFPKSLDVSKALDKMAGAQRENGRLKFKGGTQLGVINDDSWKPKDVYESNPVSEKAKQWQGWGTALKPAHEPIVLARKPLIGTVAENVLTYGTGGLNIDGGRVGSEDTRSPASKTALGIINDDGWKAKEVMAGSANGRWPANVIHNGSDEVVDYFGEPQRFFYCAKASKRDRNEGCENLPDKEWRDDGAAIPERKNRPFLPSKNNHPTVKPTDLMRYLCRLITPPNGVVLDPFMGSGSTGKAAVYEGFDFIGIEREAEYLAIAEARIAFARKGLPE